MASTTDHKEVSDSEKHTREADYRFCTQSDNLLIENAGIEETLKKHKTMAEGKKLSTLLSSLMQHQNNTALLPRNASRENATFVQSSIGEDNLLSDWLINLGTIMGDGIQRYYSSL